MTTQQTLQGPLKLGFIGGGLGSAVGNTHWCASQMDQRWQVVSGCFSKEPQANTETGKLWNVDENRVYSDWREFVAREKNTVDAVAVLTPIPSHEEIVCHLLREGVPVVCEKAMAATVEQSRTIQEALLETKGFLAVTFNYSGYPMFRELRRQIDDGKLGRLLQFQIEMPSDSFVQPRDKMSPQEWRLHDGPIPTVLLDLAAHVHHLAFFLGGLKAVSVNADYHHFSDFDRIVDDAYLWVKYEKGVQASYWVSKAALGIKNGLRVRVFGDQGAAEWYQEDPERLHIAQKDSTVITFNRGNVTHPDEIRERFKAGHPAGFVEAFANLYADIADALLQFRETGSVSSAYVFGWDHADEGLRLLTAASQANEKRMWIDL